MAAPRIDHMFNFEYDKTGAQLKKAFKDKITFLKAKIKEREGRIAKVRKDYDITDKDLIDIYSKFRSGATNSMMSNAVTYTKVIGSGSHAKVEEKSIAIGVISNIDTEEKSINEEKSQLDKAELIVRNINPGKKYKLGEQELTYLKF